VPITTNVVIFNPAQVRCTTLCNKVCQWLAAGMWFSSSTPVSSTNKHHNYDCQMKKSKLSMIIVTLYCTKSLKYRQKVGQKN